MIKRLRIKFICVIMAIVMVLLGGILGVVIHFTGRSMEMQSISMMRTIATTPFQQGTIHRGTGQEVRLPFFAVQITSQGELISASGGYFNLTNLDDLQEIIHTALDSTGDKGELEKYDLRFLRFTTSKGFTIVFSDISAEKTTMRNLIYNSILIFTVAMALFFGISILLSRWVIKPVELAWNQQRQFVADASHELKTPLSVIMANAELLESGENPSQYAGNILNMTYQMRKLVENMLEMARVDNGTLKMAFSPVDFSQLVSDSALSFQLLYEEKGLGLSWDVGEEMMVHGSEQHLYQVMDVLLDNAMKYTTPGGTVHVRLTSNGRFCTLTVANPGEAISREDLKNIFKRFYRADKARAMNGSYGLGLSIAASIVEAHKGKIWATSEKGWNTFFVQFPGKK